MHHDASTLSFLVQYQFQTTIPKIKYAVGVLYNTQERYLQLHIVTRVASPVGSLVASTLLLAQGISASQPSSPSPPLGSQKLECEEQAQFPTGSIYSVSDVPLLVAIGLRENEERCRACPPNRTSMSHSISIVLHQEALGAKYYLQVHSGGDSHLPPCMLFVKICTHKHKNLQYSYFTMGINSLRIHLLIARS
jgi:hypothetical protein